MSDAGLLAGASARNVESKSEVDALLASAREQGASFFSSDAAVGRCSRCDAEASSFESGKLLACAGCRMMWYCSRECQRADWKSGHRKNCKAVAGFASNERATHPWRQDGSVMTWPDCGTHASPRGASDALRNAVIGASELRGVTSSMLLQFKWAGLPDDFSEKFAPAR